MVRETELPPLWVQGLEEPSDKHRMRWEEVLLRRLTGRFHLIPLGDGTKEAEDRLGFNQPMVYYYVGRCHPAFGYNILAGRPRMVESMTTPFDTGAMVAAERWIATVPELGALGRRDLVRRHSYLERHYEQPWRSWFQDAFADPTDYVTGRNWPTEHVVPEIDLPSCKGDDRVWTWEARLAALDYPAPPLSEVRVMFARGTREEYVDYIDETELLTSAEKDHHSEEIYDISEEVPDPGPAMREFLKGDIEK